MATVLVLDGHLKSALCCVRSLGTSGIEVVCGAERSSAMACHSRYVRKRFVYTSPKHNQQQFIEEVLLQARELFLAEGVKPVVFCFSDATMLTLSRSYVELQEYMVLPIPSLSSIEQASDKKQTYELAQELDIPTIKMYSLEEYEHITYPAVVKNVHSIVWNQGKSSSGSASFVFSKDELRDTYFRIEKETGELPLVQEFIQGEEYGVEMVCDSGSIVACFVHKRIRSLSPRGGAAVVKETALETPEIVLMRTYAEALVTKLMWHGPIMVEFKINNKTGGVLLMEINGRFWGSLPLALAAGIDFPMLTYLLGKNTLHSITTVAPKYVRTRHFLGDCKWLVVVLFKKDRLRSVLYPSKIRALWDFKIEIFKSKGDIFDVRDSKPSIMEYIDILRK